MKQPKKKRFPNENVGELKVYGKNDTNNNNSEVQYKTTHFRAIPKDRFKKIFDFNE